MCFYECISGTFCRREGNGTFCRLGQFVARKMQLGQFVVGTKCFLTDWDKEKKEITLLVNLFDIEVKILCCLPAKDKSELSLVERWRNEDPVENLLSLI